MGRTVVDDEKMANKKLIMEEGKEDGGRRIKK
jgi:hypothetical protein